MVVIIGLRQGKRGDECQQREQHELGGETRHRGKERARIETTVEEVQFPRDLILVISKPLFASFAGDHPFDVKSKRSCFTTSY